MKRILLSIVLALSAYGSLSAPVLRSDPDPATPVAIERQWTKAEIQSMQCPRWFCTRPMPIRISG